LTDGLAGESDLETPQLFLRVRVRGDDLVFEDLVRKGKKRLPGSLPELPDAGSLAGPADGGGEARGEKKPTCSGDESSI
jgi:hypothetical protein